jgi:hypothetical protein
MSETFEPSPSLSFEPQMSRQRDASGSHFEVEAQCVWEEEIPRNRWVRFSFSTIALIMLLLPAYSQQEVDPTWYDPWAASSKIAVRNPQKPRIALRENRTEEQTKTSAAEGAGAKKRDQHKQGNLDHQPLKQVATTRKSAKSSDAD